MAMIETINLTKKYGKNVVQQMAYVHDELQFSCPADIAEEAGEIDPEQSKSRINKIYNCFDCNRMFMSAEAHANHLRDVHGGEGGSVLLKLPRDKVNGNDIEPESDEEVDKPDNDELVIDEM